MVYFVIGIIAASIILFVIGACRVAAQADRNTERMLDLMADEGEPRCDLTGQRLTVRERFEQGCG